jgi:hypothetical protein
VIARLGVNLDHVLSFNSRRFGACRCSHDG